MDQALLVSCSSDKERGQLHGAPVIDTSVSLIQQLALQVPECQLWMHPNAAAVPQVQRRPIAMFFQFPDAFGMLSTSS
jgi:hypothetical protein